MARRVKLIQLMLVIVVFLCAGKYVFAKDKIPEGEIKKEMIECAKPNGENGYYTIKPAVQIYNLMPEETVKIVFVKPNGEKVQETLAGEEKESLCIDEKWFQEGKQILEVWRENEKGEEIEESRVKKEFWIDTKQPEQVTFSYEKENEEEILCFANHTFVELGVEDKESGIKELCYQLDHGETIKKEGTNHLTVEIPLNYSGSITAWAVDQAGNRSEAVVSKYMVTENQSPEILFTSGSDLGIWHKKDIVLDVSVKDEGILSGISRWKCYVNGEKVKEKENSAVFVRDEYFSITVENLAEVVVEAVDYAGNVSSIKQRVLIDKEMPEIYIDGIDDNMITGQCVNLICEIEDNQQIESAKLNILWKNEKGIEILLKNKQWNKEKNRWKLEENLRKDGIYYLEVIGRDMAGNTSSEKYQMVIDKTDPVIRYVEDFQGKHLKEFKWEYSLSDMILDFTNYTYEIRLDGKLKNMWGIEKSEGKHIFSVSATDSAGNISEVKAEFIVDHTSPVILYDGVENEGCYEEKAEAVISTEEERDRITEILINGQRQNLNLSQGIFEFTFDEPGKYELSVKAEDRAGNKTTQKIVFEVKKKENILEKIFYNDQVEIKQDREIKPKKEKETDMSGLYIIAALGIGGIFLNIVILYKKKKAYKREDAG